HARTMSRPLPSQVSASTIRAPLAATPFPSTTLFRSDNGQIFAWITGGVMAALGLTVAILMITVMAEFSGVPADAWIYVILGLLGDRKSTRLNSSHVKSSYAVFCLKKKNEQQTRNDQS